MQKKLGKVVAAIAIAATAVFVQNVQAQSAVGSTLTETFTVKPADGKNGYEVQITLTYRFQFCGDQITLDGYRSNHTALAYHYQGKRYSANEAGGFKSGRSDLYPNLDFSADVYSSSANYGRIAGGSWNMVNLQNWGGCLGDYGNGGTGLKDKNLVPALYLKNIRPKDSPQIDYNIENRFRQQQQTSAFNVSTAQQNYNSEMQKIRNSENNSNTAFETQKREVQRQNERQQQQNQQRYVELQRRQAESQQKMQRQTELQQKLDKAATDMANIIINEMQRKEQARIAREEREEEEARIAREEARIREEEERIREQEARERRYAALSILKPQQERYAAAAAKAISANMEQQFLAHYNYYSQQIDNVRRTSYVSNTLAMPAPVDFSRPEPELSAAVCYEAAVRKAKIAVTSLPEFDNEVRNLLAMAKTFPDYDYNKNEAAKKAIDNYYLSDMKNEA